MTGFKRLRWRHARWAIIAAALPVLWACNARKLEEPMASPKRVEQKVFQETLNRDVDILFLIDTSSSMRPLQDKLLQNFPVFMTTLEGIQGGLPNVHIGVISSDLGAGPFIDVPQCRPGGDLGLLQNAPRGACQPPNGQFISSIGPNRNYTGTIAETFTCIAALGDTGCGFEHQFASLRAALDPNLRPVQNDGFLRDTAYLAVILITNEDDCSAPPDSDLFDPGQRLVSDTYGPLSSFRCNEYGHLCNGAPPPRTSGGALTGCVSNEAGKLLPVAAEIAFLKSLKADPNKVLVAAITGPTEPYNVQMLPVMNAMTGTSEDQPAIAHSCSENSGEYADPSVRIKTWVDGFGRNGLFMPICAPSFAPSLQLIAAEIGKVLGPKCVEGQLLDNDPNTPDVQPDCQVSDRGFTAEGNAVESAVPSCDASGGARPCWNLVDDADNCPGAKVLQVTRDGAAPPDTNTAIACAVCVPNSPDPRCQQ
jgi:hypothetical protein